MLVSGLRGAHRPAPHVHLESRTSTRMSPFRSTIKQDAAGNWISAIEAVAIEIRVEQE
jgi:hypothetical protein